MYQAIYYWMYTYLSKIKTNDNPAFNAQAIIILLEETNLISIGRPIYKMTLLKSDLQVATICGVFIALLLIGFNFFYLYQRREIIFKQVREYSESKLRVSNYIFWLYVIGSLLSFFGVVEFS